MKLLKTLIISILLLFGITLAQDNPKAVINLTTGDISKFKMYLLSGLANSAEYYKNNLKDLKVVVIIHGDAYKFFVKDLENSPYKDDKTLLENQKELQTKLEYLHKNYGLRFQMCEQGMKSRKINPKTLYPFVELIPNAFIGLVDWQNEGYAYIPLY
ncbi:DsrE family protein [Sulfurihydrogenibium sp.]|uniref:DsrE family protein n=1 Tax=Sulfurihydrogenibium sp. TaxID=2053621 RepID=UPI00262E03D8|nr:DsrE family protein [Sulfurihydrogenibium sp.]